MTQAPRLALLTILIGLVAGCSTTTRQAPVVERPVTAAPSRPAPARVEEAPKQDERGMYTVRKGDTLLRIALDFGQNYRDLVTWNNLANPDDIKVGQVLRVTQPEGERTANVQTQPVPMPPSASVPRKTEPRADKTPYSEGKVATATPPLPTQLSVLTPHRRLKDPKIRLFTDFVIPRIRAEMAARLAVLPA